MNALPLLTDHFDHVIVINCAHRKDRLAEFWEEVNGKGLVDPAKVAVFSAVVGDHTTHPAGWGAGGGAWGCLRSHQRILEDLMHHRDDRGSLDWGGALILEDDVFFLDGALENLAAFMAAVPSNWGQLYLGGQHRMDPSATADPAVVMGNSVHRTHAYAVSSHYIQRVYQHISYMPDYQPRKHIDHQLELAHRRKDWPVYCPPRWLCGQRASASDIGRNITTATTWQ